MDTPAPIRRRLVCYLSGFDPQGPAHYQQLYATEGAKQATVGGYKLTVGKRRKQSEHIAFWDVRQDSEDGVVETRYEFLRWDDIVRQHWPRGRAALLGRTVFASWHMWRNGVMWRTLKTSWPIFIAAAVPGGLVLVFAVLVPALLVVAVWWALQGLWPTATASLVVGFPLLAWAAAVAERRSHMGWLMRSFACLVKQGKGQTPELEARLDMFGAHVAQQVRIKRFDEVLVVGHSSGAMMAMAVMARALAALPTSNEDASPSAPISLLTLGHCTPLLSGQAEAAGFRSELQALRTHQRLCWVDYGAPADGCCFPLSDPTAACGVADSGDNVPKLLNPRFAQLFSATRYQHVRRDKFRCHFQYLMASEVAGSYDYFAITAGPQSLAQRHASLNGVRDFKQFQCFGGPLL